MREIVTQIQDFASQGEIFERRWFVNPKLHIYVRKGRHFIDTQGKTVDTLDLANISAYPPGQKIFTRFLEKLEQVSPLPIFIENVDDERFKNFFLKRGYTPLKNARVECFIRVKPANLKLE